MFGSLKSLIYFWDSCDYNHYNHYNNLWWSCCLLYPSGRRGRQDLAAAILICQDDSWISSACQEIGMRFDLICVIRARWWRHLIRGCVARSVVSCPTPPMTCQLWYRPARWRDPVSPDWLGPRWRACLEWPRGLPSRGLTRSHEKCFVTAWRTVLVHTEHWRRGHMMTAALSPSVSPFPHSRISSRPARWPYPCSFAPFRMHCSIIRQIGVNID